MLSKKIAFISLKFKPTKKILDEKGDDIGYPRYSIGGDIGYPRYSIGGDIGYPPCDSAHCSFGCGSHAEHAGALRQGKPTSGRRNWSLEIDKTKKNNPTLSFPANITIRFHCWVISYLFQHI